MASLSEIPHGRIVQIESKLAGAGCDSRHVDALLQDRELAVRWVNQLNELMSSSNESAGQQFRSSELMYGAFRAEAEEQNWPFGRAEMEKLWSTRPRDFKSINRRALGLRVWLGDLQRTFDAHCAWLGRSCEVSRTDFDSSATTLRLEASSYHETQPSVRWVRVNPMAYQRRNVPSAVRPVAVIGSRDTQTDIRPFTTVEVLALAALHPEWRKTAAYTTPGGMWLAGLEYAGSSGEFWMIPQITFSKDGATVHIFPYNKAESVVGSSIPTCRKL